MQQMLLLLLRIGRVHHCALTVAVLHKHPAEISGCLQRPRCLWRLYVQQLHGAFRLCIIYGIKGYRARQTSDYIPC